MDSDILEKEEDGVSIFESVYSGLILRLVLAVVALSNLLNYLNLSIHLSKWSTSQYSPGRQNQ